MLLQRGTDFNALHLTTNCQCCAFEHKLLATHRPLPMLDIRAQAVVGSKSFFFQCFTIEHKHWAALAVSSNALHSASSESYSLQCFTLAQTEGHESYFFQCFLNRATSVGNKWYFFQCFAFGHKVWAAHGASANLLHSSEGCEDPKPPPPPPAPNHAQQNVRFSGGSMRPRYFLVSAWRAA